MNNSYNFPTTGINKYMSKYISRLGRLDNKVVVDIPAGDGRTSYNFLKIGARVLSFDLFPKFFSLKEIECNYADLQDALPVPAESVDYLVCQEGIEHISNQYKVFCEFNRVLKADGRVLLTTPNLSNIRSRLSMFLIESEFWKRQAPSEVDSVWFSESNNKDIYFGHLFLMNIQKVRSLAAISGFEIVEVNKTKVSPSAAVLATLFYPLLVLTNLLSYAFYFSKNKHVDAKERKRVFLEQIKLNLNPKILACKHLFLVMRKVRSLEDNVKMLKEMTRSEGTPTITH